MPETNGPDREDDRFEQRKREATEVLLAESLRFVKWDGDINDMVKDLLGTIVGEVKRNPGTLFTSQADSSEALLSALRAQAAKGGSGVSGGAITGGGPFGDIIEFIKSIGDLAADEKKFFLKIIFMVFCGCDCVCRCLCDDK